MKQHLNTLFVMTPGAYLRKDGEAVVVQIDGQTKLCIPLHHLGSVIAFGAVGASPPLLGACARAGVSVTFLTQRGGLLARVTGFTTGNVLLRREQFARSEQEPAALSIARMMVIGKLANCRHVLMRGARDYPERPCSADLSRTAARLGQCIDEVPGTATLDILRGLEGDAARAYFAVFNALITAADSGFHMAGRSRRPPLDPLNALLSFLYMLLASDTRVACEAVGLDPQVGFLHALRPGRPALALDLMEELRPLLADRLALSLINRRQIQVSGIRPRETGGFEMDEETRKTVLVAYQKRKQESIMHPFLGESTTIGLLPHLQARLLARYLRGELDAYPPLIVK